MPACCELLRCSSYTSAAAVEAVRLGRGDLIPSADS